MPFDNNPYSSNQYAGIGYNPNMPSTGSFSPSVSDSGGSDAASLGLMGAGAASANPYVLAATIGLGLLQQRAADERARRQRAMEIEQQYGQNQNQALQNLNNTYARALKR